VRCHCCHTIILDSDVECWHCGSQRSDFQTFRFIAVGSRLLSWCLLIGLLGAAAGYALKFDVERDVEEELLQQQQREGTEIQQLQWQKQQIEQQRRERQQFEELINNRGKAKLVPHFPPESARQPRYLRGAALG
jgi:hypothetical protein